MHHSAACGMPCCCEVLEVVAAHMRQPQRHVSYSRLRVSASQADRGTTWTTFPSKFLNRLIRTRGVTIPPRTRFEVNDLDVISTKLGFRSFVLMDSFAREESISKVTPLACGGDDHSLLTPYHGTPKNSPDDARTRLHPYRRSIPKSSAESGMPFNSGNRGLHVMAHATAHVPAGPHASAEGLHSTHTPAGPWCVEGLTYRHTVLSLAATLGKVERRST